MKQNNTTNQGAKMKRKFADYQYNHKGYTVRIEKGLGKYWCWTVFKMDGDKVGMLETSNSMGEAYNLKREAKQGALDYIDYDLK